MVLSALVPEMWLYGYVGAIMTQNLYFGPAMVSVIYLGFVWLFKHRNDPDPLDIHFHITLTAMTWLGAFVAMFFMAFFRPPRFVTTRIFNSNGDFQPFFFFFVLFVFLVVEGVYAIMEGLLGSGITLTVIFSLLIVGAIIVYLYNFWTMVGDGLAQIKYTVLFSLVAALPAANDYLITTGNRPHNIWIFLLFLVLVFVLFYTFVVLVKMPRREKFWWEDQREHTTKRVFTLAFFTPIVLVYVPSLIADQAGEDQFGSPGTPEEEETKIWYTVISAFIGSAVSLLIMLVWSWREEWRGHQLSSGWDAGAGTAYSSSVKVPEEDAISLTKDTAQV